MVSGLGRINGFSWPSFDNNYDIDLEAIVKTSIRSLVFAIYSLMLYGCQLGNPATPTALPTGSVAGFVVGSGPVAGATVTVYGPDGVLASTRTDDGGHFAVSLRALSGTLSVSITGGSSSGTAAGTSAAPGPMEGFFSYQEGHAMDIAVTPFTTAAASLTRFFVVQGLSLGAAAAKADSEFASWLGFDEVSTIPVLASQLTTAQPFDAGVRYGLVIAALSQWAQSQSLQTVATITATMVADLANDGVLNGRGAQGALFLGSEPLSPAAYRDGIANALVQVAASNPAGTPASLSGPDATAVIAYARNLAQGPVALFGNEVPPPFAANPLALNVPAWPAWTHGSFLVTGFVTDPFTLAATVTIAIDGQALSLLQAAPTFAFAVNTMALSDGQHSVVITAHDAAGLTASVSRTLGVDNSLPRACLLVYEPLVPTFIASGQWQDISGVVAASINGLPAQLSGTDIWYGTGPLTAGPLVLTLTDAAGNVNTFSWAVSPLSNPAPCP